jgi:hypothetical protein
MFTPKALGTVVGIARPHNFKPTSFAGKILFSFNKMDHACILLYLLYIILVMTVEAGKPREGDTATPPPEGVKMTEKERAVELVRDLIGRAKEHLVTTPWEIETLHELAPEHIEARQLVEQGLDKIQRMYEGAVNSPKSVCGQRRKTDNPTVAVRVGLGNEPSAFVTGTMSEISTYLQSSTEGGLLPTDRWRDQLFVFALESMKDFGVRERMDFARIVRNAIKAVDIQLGEEERGRPTDVATENKARYGLLRAELEDTVVGQLEITHNLARFDLSRRKTVGLRTTGLRATLYPNKLTVHLMVYPTSKPASIDGPILTIQRGDEGSSPEEVFTTLAAIAGVAYDAKEPDMVRQSGGKRSRGRR